MLVISTNTINALLIYSDRGGPQAHTPNGQG